MNEQFAKQRGPLSRVRAIIWGAVTGMILVMGVALPIAWARNEQPFSHKKGAADTSMRVARWFGVPAGALMGAMIGAWAATAFRKDQDARASDLPPDRD